MEKSYEEVAEVFGSSVFNDAVMSQRLPKDVYKSLKETMAGMQPLDPTIANVVAMGEADIYYGECVMVDAQGEVIGSRRLVPPKELTWESLRMGMLVSHQSIFVKRVLAPQYNLTYKFAADFDWVLKSLKGASTVVNTNMVISRFLDGGLTKQNIIPGLKERYHIMKTHFGGFSTFFRHFVIGTKFLWFVLLNKRF